MMVSYVNKHSFIVAINHSQEKDHHHFRNWLRRQACGSENKVGDAENVLSCTADPNC